MVLRIKTQYILHTNNNIYIRYNMSKVLQSVYDTLGI